jgi:hypothetical protein
MVGRGGSIGEQASACSAGRGVAVALLLALGLLFPCRGSAQETWEFSPYQVRLWIASDHHPALSPALREQVASTIEAACHGSVGYQWRLEATPPPGALASEMVQRLDDLEVDQVLAADRSALRRDKLVLIVLSERQGEFIVALRELDCATRLWNAPVRFTTRLSADLPQLAATGVVEAVRPVAKVDKVDGRNWQARVRAGGLVSEGNSWGALPAGSLLQPVVRRNGRNGEPLPQGIRAPPWSYAAVESREDSVVRGTLHSGYGSVLPVKGGPRTERFLVQVKPRYNSTRLVLQARPTAPESRRGGARAGRPLAGYEVFVKHPGEETTELVGLTDWQGKIVLTRDVRPLQLFYIRNGGQLLARLPIVVGDQAEVSANVIDDDPRLLVETYIKAMQSRVMDLVARREILAVRTRAKLKKGEYSEARGLVEEFRQLPSRIELSRELEETQRRARSVPGITGKRIDRLFQDGQRLLMKFLDPAAAERLAQEVAEAEKQGPPAESTPASSASPAPTT